MSIILASLIVPAQRRLRPWIDRRFFAERHALERGVEGLLRELSTCASPEALLTLAGVQLHRLLRLDRCVIYGRSVEEGYAPVWVGGADTPPVLAVDSPLVRRLEGIRAPLLVDARRWRAERTPNPAGVMACVPIIYDDDLGGLCDARVEAFRRCVHLNRLGVAHGGG